MLCMCTQVGQCCRACSVTVAAWRLDKPALSMGHGNWRNKSFVHTCTMHWQLQLDPDRMMPLRLFLAWQSCAMAT